MCPKKSYSSSSAIFCDSLKKWEKNVLVSTKKIRVQINDVDAMNLRLTDAECADSRFQFEGEMLIE